MPYPVFDLHCDTADRLAWQSLPAMLRQALGMGFYGPGDESDPTGITELARNHGMISLERIGDTPWAQCFACYIPDELSPNQALSFFQHVSAYLEREVEKNQQRAVLARCAADIRPALESGAVVAIKTIENATLFAADPELVDTAAQAGVLMASLSWNAPGPLASGHDAEDRGITAAGLDVIRRMEEQRMVLDVSHLNDRCFDDVCRLSTRPFVASHSNCRSVCGHPRNLTDGQIAEIRDCGGLIGINYCIDFLRDDARTHKPDFDDISRHIDHLLNLGCEDAIALGSDFDGCDTPGCIATASEMPRFQQQLDARFGAELTAKICAGNALGFFERWGR